MTLVTLLTQLANQDIRLWLEDGQLRFSAPDGAMTDAIIADIRAQKSDIIAFLQKSEASQSVNITATSREKDWHPVSFAQQRFWFLQKIAPDNAAYHIHTTLSIKGDLNPAGLEKALIAVANRHEILHTRYAQIDGQLMQQVMDTIDITLPETATTIEEANKAIYQQINRPFDLANGDVFHARLFHINQTEWLFAFTIHHIASDGWSLNLLIQDLIRHYESKVPNLTSPELHYLDYAVWQHEATDHKAQLDYWQHQLAGLPVLSLPTDFKTQTIDDEQNNEAAFCDICLNTADFTALKQLAKDESTSLFVVLMTAYALLLQKYCQQQDFAIGTPIACRNHSQLESIMGCFINTLAIRFDIHTDASFLDLLNVTRQTIADAFMHQDVPFEHVVRQLGESYDPSVSPVFQTLFSLQEQSFSAANVNGLEIEAKQPAFTAAQFDLKFTALDDDNLKLRFEYKKARFSEAKIARMSMHLIHLLKSIARKPEQKIKQLRFSDSDAGLLLGKGEFNDTATDTIDSTIHQLFEQQVNKTPDTIAVSDDKSRLSYAQLNRKANQLAHYLIEKGFTERDVIGLCLPRGINVVLAQLAILKAGCAYLPIELDLPTERQQFMLNQANVNCLISQSDQPLTVDPISSVFIDQIDLNECVDTNLDFYDPKSLFNVIFTSGSTGEPKGVMVSHSAIVNRLLWMQKQFNLDANDCVLQKTPYGFDVSVWEFFWPLIAGSRCHFLPPEDHKDPQALARTIEQESVTCIHFVPSMLSPFLAQPNLECKSLRYLFCSGEALSIAQMQHCDQRLPDAALYNLYGPTEAAIDVSWYRCKADAPYASVPIGQPIDNIQLHILDEDLQPTPLGIAGELYIGGRGLADGYINKHSLTSQSFIDNPFKSQDHPSDKLYRTGDLVKMSEDNNLLYLGRRDGQIKLRGQRIELSEIEQQLMATLGVEQAVVLLKHQPKTHEATLVAYVPVAETDTIKTRLGERLPASMLPTYYIHASEWPLTLSGKIDRKRLPEPEWSLSAKNSYVAAHTDTEKALVAIWQQSLGVDKIGIQDDFFELGGHSLKAVEILAKAQEQFGLEIPLKSIFAHPNIEAIAGFIDNHLIAEAVFSDNQPVSDDETDSFVI